jgi:diguanylate cyclase (GGDEF)-like protein/PAS domain S-box-containing protein
VYTSETQLKEFIHSNELHLYPSILLQAYVGSYSIEAIMDFQAIIHRLLPHVSLLGCNSNGQVFNGDLVSEPVLTFTVFETTEITTGFIELPKPQESQKRGIEFYRKLAKYDTKAIILLASHLNLQIPEFLASLHKESDGVKVAGALAADLPENKPAYVFTNHAVSQNGVAAVSLNNENLHVHSFIVEQWQEVGQPFTITKAKGKIIYKINEKKPVQLFEEYLGANFVEELPNSGAEFPFLLNQKDEKVAVYVIKLIKGGAIEVSHAVEEGQELTFAFANIEGIMHKVLTELKFLEKNPLDAHFVYNCIARKKYISDITQQEMRMFNEISPISGLFSHGEIGQKENSIPKVFAHSLSYLGLSETTKKPLTDKKFEFQLKSEVKTKMNLANLINASARDIKALTESSQVSEEYYRSLFDNNTDFVYSTDLNGKFNSINPSFTKTFGYSTEEVLGKSAINFVSNEDRAKVQRHFLRALKGKTQYYDLRIPSKLGELNYFQIKNVPITVNDQCVGLFGIGRNITKEYKSEQKITQLAYYDSETGLPNKTKFKEIAEEMINRAKKKNRVLAVMFLDMDRFKVINDTLGHTAGDNIIKKMAERLSKSLPKGAYLGRFSGDKFTILLTKDADLESVSATAKKVLQLIQMPIYYQNQEFFITASIGIAILPQDGNEVTELLRNADAALNRAKLQGGNGIVYFSTKMNEEAIRKVEMESSLRKAIERNELFMTYQPIVTVDNQKPIGCEALIRWRHPEWGIVPPVDFIPLAEETGLIYEIGKWVLVQSCIQLKKWLDNNSEPFYISVNVSAIQFQNKLFLHDVKKALSISGIPPECLCLELTETVMLHHSQHMLKMMNSLADLGIKIAIDDFGTGYSSLSYLKNLPVHILKIDRSFVQNMNDHTPDIAIVQSVSTMGRGLNMKVLAEGVETKHQLELLHQLGCDYAQGYLIEKPMQQEDMTKWLQRLNLILN